MIEYAGKALLVFYIGNHKTGIGISPLGRNRVSNVKLNAPCVDIAWYIEYIDARLVYSSAVHFLLATHDNRNIAKQKAFLGQGNFYIYHFLERDSNISRKHFPK